jgi:transcriptional regulator GlxA family with amidase domain
MLVDLNRTSQAPFAVFIPNKRHNDEAMLQAQEWMEANYKKSFQMDELATKAGLSLRQFNRRFKSATGETAVKYLQQVRVDASKLLLATTQKTFDEISPIVGYENVSFFRKVFRNSVGLTPLDFRRKFGKFPQH